MNTEQMIAVNKRMKVKRGRHGGGCNSAGAPENGDRGNSEGESREEGDWGTGEQRHGYEFKFTIFFVISVSVWNSDMFHYKKSVCVCVCVLAYPKISEANKWLVKLSWIWSPYTSPSVDCVRLFKALQTNFKINNQCFCIPVCITKSREWLYQHLSLNAQNIPSTLFLYPKGQNVLKAADARWSTWSTLHEESRKLKMFDFANSTIKPFPKKMELICWALFNPQKHWKAKCKKLYGTDVSNFKLAFGLMHHCTALKCFQSCCRH